jgi:hypothetical protein
MASRSRKKLPLKRALEPRRGRANDDESPPKVISGRIGQTSEKRSKHRNDEWQVQRRSKEKGKAIARSPAPKKRRKGVWREESEEEELAMSEDSEDDSSDRRLVLTIKSFLCVLRFCRSAFLSLCMCPTLFTTSHCISVTE